MDESILLTFDIDWAADHMVDAIARELIERDVKATWLVTHASPAIDRLRGRPDLFELGIHPNFLADSSHGATVAEVLQACMKLVPEATSMRSHALVQSSVILQQVIGSTPIRCDSSLMLPDAPNLAPVGFPHADGPLVRVPYFWEDDVEMMRPEPRWTLEEHGSAPGLRVFDFHPALVFLNAADLGPYRELKRLGPLSAVPEEMTAGLVRPGPGPRDLLLEIAEHLSAGGSRTLREVAATHLRSEVT